MTQTELLAILREAREDVDAMGNGDLCRAIDRALAIHDAALAGAPERPPLTDHQKEWVVRICRAAIMWGSRSHGDYVINRNSDAPESFSPLELANRVLAEVGITGSFTMPESVPAKKKRGK